MSKDQELKELRNQYREYMTVCNRDMDCPDSIMMANIEEIKTRIDELEK